MLDISRRLEGDQTVVLYLSGNLFHHFDPPLGVHHHVEAATSTASASDLIAYPNLSHLPPIAQQHLFSIFNRSWSSHTFSSCWKSATIILVYKPGKPTDSPASLRPVSLTSCMSNLIERRAQKSYLSSIWLSTRKVKDLPSSFLVSICLGRFKKRPPDRTCYTLQTCTPHTHTHDYTNLTATF